MEFGNVYAINCAEDTMPNVSSIKENVEEERRVLYVGITKAIDNLYLFYPRNRKGQIKEVLRFIVEGKLKEYTERCRKIMIVNKNKWRYNQL